MAGTGRALEASGWKWHRSPYFIAAIAETESSLGAAACRKDGHRTYNAFGLASCGRGWYVPDFVSWAHAYDFVAHYLATMWPHARTTYDYVRPKYAACPECWGWKTASHMRNRFGVGSSVLYH